MYQKLNRYIMMNSIFGTGFDIYDPCGQPAYYRTRHTFPTKKEAINAIFNIILEKKNEV